MPISSFSFPTAIHFGPGARRLVADHLKRVGVKRPLVVTDKGLATLPILRDFGDGLAALDVRIYPGVYGNPTRQQVVDGVRALKAHAADAVIGFGGARRSASPRRRADGGARRRHSRVRLDHPRVRPITMTLPYFVALPPPAAGQRVGLSAVISDDVTHVKKIVFSPALLARAVFADPELTLELPAGVTAATGMDALTHNVESYLSPAYHPLCDGIALEGARIAAHALETAVAMPKNIGARSDMMMASMMGAIAFQKDLGAVHSCAHALGTVADMHHGLANGIMIDHVMRFNPTPPSERWRSSRASAAPAPRRCLRRLLQLKARIGIPAHSAAEIADQVPSWWQSRQGHLPPDQSQAGLGRRFREDLLASPLGGCAAGLESCPGHRATTKEETTP
jgi:alcohol dehydrogenase class IV